MSSSSTPELRARLGAALVGAVAALACACGSSVVIEETPYHDEFVQPVFDARCTSSPDAPCHADDGTGRAPSAQARRIIGWRVVHE